MDGIVLQAKFSKIDNDGQLTLETSIYCKPSTSTVHVDFEAYDPTNDPMFVKDWVQIRGDIIAVPKGRIKFTNAEPIENSYFNGSPLESTQYSNVVRMNSEFVRRKYWVENFKKNPEFPEATHVDALKASLPILVELQLPSRTVLYNIPSVNPVIDRVLDACQTKPKSASAPRNIEGKYVIDGEEEARVAGFTVSRVNASTFSVSGFGSFATDYGANTGSFEGTFKLNGNRALSTPEGFDCEIVLTFQEQGAMIEKESGCGGMNVSFNGRYRKE